MILSVVSGVEDAGFTTTVQPAASAGLVLVPINVIGKFQGTIAPQTPTGCLITIPYIFGSGNSLVPDSDVGGYVVSDWRERSIVFFLSGQKSALKRVASDAKEWIEPILE